MSVLSYGINMKSENVTTPRVTTVLAAAIDALALAKECGGDLDKEVYRKAHAQLAALCSEVQAYDSQLNKNEVAPTGDDYNALLALFWAPVDQEPATTAVTSLIQASTGAELQQEADDAIRGLDKMQLELARESDLVGYGIQAAGQLLLANWKTAIGEGSSHALIEDVDALITRLGVLRQKARLVLPIANGGFAGIDPNLLDRQLKLAGVTVYASRDGESYGFTGCDVDEFDTYDDAFIAALQAHPDVVAAARMHAVQG